MNPRVPAVWPPKVGSIYTVTEPCALNKDFAPYWKYTCIYVHDDGVDKFGVFKTIHVSFYYTANPTQFAGLERFIMDGEGVTWPPVLEAHIYNARYGKEELFKVSGVDLFASKAWLHALFPVTELGCTDIVRGPEEFERTNWKYLVKGDRK